MTEQKEHWAIERKIPIALLTALSIQTGVWIWQSAAAWACAHSRLGRRPRAGAEIVRV
jgi:hypothetical protein